MPFNVIDRQGRPIGVLANRFTIDHPNSMIFMVGLTNQRLEPMDIDYEKISNIIAYSLDCTTVFGSVKTEKFENALKEKWRNEYSQFGYYDEHFLIRYLMLYRSVLMEDYLRLSRFDFDGYILIDGNHLIFSENHEIIIETEEFEIAPIFSREYGIPIHCKVTGIPRVETQIIRSSQPWEMNHAHTTMLPVTSGSVSLDLTVPFVCPMKVNTKIQVLFVNEKIAGVFGDGIFYTISN